MKLPVNHMIVFEPTIKEVVGDTWGIVVGSPMFGKTIVIKGSKLYSEFQKIHSPMYLVLFAMIYNANTFVQLQFGQKKGLEFVCTAWVVKTYQTKSELTGRGIATVRNITQEVWNIILDKLWKKIVVFPKTKEEFFNSISAMETLWLFPTAFGGVDGCHIPLKCPHGVIEARKEYYNFKSFYSVVMMGIVGADYRF